MNDKLRAAALAVLKSTKSLSVCCENFNHRKQDFHDDGKCPPWRRYNDALAELEDAVAEQEYICKCGLRVVSHQCKTDKEF